MKILLTLVLSLSTLNLAFADSCVRKVESAFPAKVYKGKTKDGRVCEVKVNYDNTYGNNIWAEARVLNSSADGDFVGYDYKEGHYHYHMEKCDVSRTGIYLKTWDKCEESYCGKKNRKFEVSFQNGRLKSILVQQGSFVFAEKILCLF